MRTGPIGLQMAYFSVFIKTRKASSPLKIIRNKLNKCAIIYLEIDQMTFGNQPSKIVPLSVCKMCKKVYGAFRHPLESKKIF